MNWFAVAIGSVIGSGIGILAFWTRWGRWNVLCWRGRRCADVEANAISAPGDPRLFIEYVCGRCHTRYQWNSFDRTRQRT